MRSLAFESIPTYALLGVEVHALTMAQLNGLIGEAVEQQQKWIIANHNLHSIYLYHREPKMRSFYAAAPFTHIDGMPLVLLGRFLKLPLMREHRTTYADWIWSLAREAAKQEWRIFYLGSKIGVADQGAAILREKFPGIQIKTAHGYFNTDPSSKENQSILDQIKAYQPHVLMVGMGMPRQELWILDNLEVISANAILPSGACLDYVAGAIPTPPRWMGYANLEWLYRLASEPRRLWKRYLVEPLFLVCLYGQDLFNRYIQKL